MSLDPRLHEPTDRPIDLAILLGDPRISGGTNVLLEHALAMRAAGHRVTLLTPSRVSDADLAWKAGAASIPRREQGALGARRFDLALATWWRSALDLTQVHADRCAYFVQSIESRFFAGDHTTWQARARATYSLPLPVITEASWIADHLRSLHGREVSVVRNGIDKTLFDSAGPLLEPVRASGLRVLVEGPLGVPYKRVELALRLCQRAAVDEIWLLTATPCTSWPGVDRVLSRLSPREVGAAMRSCDVLLKLSTVEGMFGPPLEMMHCGGTAITSDVSGHEEYMRDGDNGFVVPQGEELAVIDLLRLLRRDRDLLIELRKGARDTARSWPSWQESTTAMRLELERLARSAIPSSTDLAPTIRDAARVRPLCGAGLPELFRRHARAFVRTRLPTLAARVDRGERSVRSAHPVAALPAPPPPCPITLPSRPRIVILGAGEFAEHFPTTSTAYEVVRRPATSPDFSAADDLVITCDARVAARFAARDQGPPVALLAVEPPRDFEPSARCLLYVSDLEDGLALRARGHHVAGTWLPPVPTPFFVIDASPHAWHRRARTRIALSDGAGDGSESLPLASPAELLHEAFAHARFVELPRRPRRPRLAAARAMLAMASGCIVVTPGFGLDYGALPGEHFVTCRPSRRRVARDGGRLLEALRASGRSLAERHGAERRMQRLLAALRKGERHPPRRMLADRPSP